MVGLGIMRDNPDYYAIEVFNEVLAGGFSSRLIQSFAPLRDWHTQSAAASASALITLGFCSSPWERRASITVESIKALYPQIDELKTKPIDDTEIARAEKDSILNTFVFNFDTPDKVLRERMAYEFYGYPADFLDATAPELKR